MVLYKEFRVGDLMDMKSGKRVTKKKQIKGDIPYVTAVSTNNGIDSYIGNPPFVVNNVITMSFLGDGFYHPYDVSFKDGTYGFKLKEEGKESREVYLYLLTQIKKQGSQLGDYSNGLRGNQIVEFIIQLPVKTLEDTEPDWEYMEEYIKQKELTYIDKLNLEFEKKKEQLIELIGEESGYINIDDLPTAKFKVKDLYDNIYRGKRITKNDRVKGDIPLVTAGKEALGISEYIKGHTTQGVSNTITIDMFGNVFYRDYPYYMDDNIIVLHNEDISKENNLYIASTLNCLKEEYSYASQFRMKSLESVKIELPINPEVSEIVPDWKTMEDYVNGIKHLYLHKEESNHKEKLELLYELTGWTEQDLANIENLGGQ